VVALNRAIAIGELQDPAAALSLVEELEDLDNYYPFHATRVDLLGRLGRHREALPPTSALRPWRRPRPSESSSEWVAGPRAE
jgi:predicted RNA polymerase sigma factor